MKKSEAVKKLNAFVEERFNLPSFIKDDSVLKFIEEELGMVAPEYEKVLTDTEIDNLGVDHMSYYSGVLDVNEWEKEDGT